MLARIVTSIENGKRQNEVERILAFWHRKIVMEYDETSSCLKSKLGCDNSNYVFEVMNDIIFIWMVEIQTKDWIARLEHHPSSPK